MSDLTITSNSNTAVKPDVPLVINGNQEEKADMSRRVELRGAYMPSLQKAANILPKSTIYAEIGIWLYHRLNTDTYKRNGVKVLGGIKAENIPGYNGSENLKINNPYFGIYSFSGKPYGLRGQGIEASLIFNFPGYEETAIYKYPNREAEKLLASMQAFKVELQAKGMFRFSQKNDSIWKNFGGYAAGKLTGFSADREDISERYFYRFPIFQKVRDDIYIPDRTPRDIGGLSYALECGLKLKEWSLGVEYAQDRQNSYYPLYKGYEHYDSWAVTGGLELERKGFALVLKPRFTFKTTEVDTTSKDEKAGQAYPSKFDMYFKAGFKVLDNMEIFAEGMLANCYPSSAGIGIQIKRF